MADNAVEKSGGSNTITIPAWLRRHAVSVGDKDNAPLSDVALLPSIQEYLNEHGMIMLIYVYYRYQIAVPCSGSCFAITN